MDRHKIKPDSKAFHLVSNERDKYITTLVNLALCSPWMVASS